MNRLTLVIAPLLGLSFLSSVAVTQQRAEPSSDPPPLERMPKDLEVRLALSAVPQHLCAGATLLGGSHFSESTSGITGGGNQFAFLLGGGGDVVFNSSRKLALRLEGDYVGIRSSGSPAMRLGVGIVYRFGGS